MTEALFPPPRSVRRGDDTWRRPHGPWRVAGAAPPVAARLTWALGPWSECTDDPELRLERSSELQGGAYRLSVGADGVVLESGALAGTMNGLATLRQWLRASGEELRAVVIDDAPSFEIRGVMLDVSRNKVPTLATLLELIELLGALKINHLQLYTEHTFAYAGHERVWRGWSPLTPRDIRTLDAACRSHGIELAPNQNSFGHLHRWLVHPEYRDLAECPGGILHPFGFEREPFSLNPLDPRSLSLLEDLYDQLLPHFSSRRINVGLDETFDLGEGRSRDACLARGKGRVYVDFLEKVHRLVQRRNHTMLFWGDIVLESPDLIEELPRDVVALEWGYEGDHPFDEHGRQFAASGLEFWVCPGTSSWNSLSGRTENALENLARAAAAGHQHGARGYLITDWGDFGHLQPLPVSLTGFVAGAGCAWSATEAPQPALVQRSIDSEWQCEGLGEALDALGRTHEPSGVKLQNHTVLFQLFNMPHREIDHPVWEKLTEAGLEASRDALGRCADAARALSDPLVRAELLWVADTLTFACDLGVARCKARSATRDLPGPVRQDLARRLGDLDDRYAPLWLARNRPGGLQASRDRFATLERHLSPH